MIDSHAASPPAAVSAAPDRVRLDCADDTRSLHWLEDRGALAYSLFEHAPVSLWLEDFRQIKARFDALRAEGVTDLRAFVTEHPEFVAQSLADIVVLDVNRETLDMLNAPDKATLLASLPQTLGHGVAPSFLAQLLDLWDGRLFQQRDAVHYSLDGTPVSVQLQLSVLPGHEPHWDLVLLALTDVTARDKAQAQLEHLSQHDALTRLSNRAFYFDELHRLECEGPFPLSVILLDVDDLRHLNDYLGPAAGDALLCRAGEVLGDAVHGPGLAARIGGDEFAVLLPGADEREAQTVLEEIARYLSLANARYARPTLAFAIGTATAHTRKRLKEALRVAQQRMTQDQQRHREARALHR
ncbi:GGDEF domain-containing protein [Trinickia fusca]|uniref:GGDEF domain-containing protein n=1 Tax=Trinickia fusca TaxID=2419777 RepID=A0A494XSH3_9BURK|nr:GGDEF domain-containing protein [Trinickia fusca]RKP52611.1 GGDEF domain-containing protein [Trinickia fusca]